MASPYSKSPTSTAQTYAAVTPADTDLSRAARGLFVGTGGTVVCSDAKGDVTTWKVPSGGYVHGVVTRVAEASTATDIVALYD